MREFKDYLDVIIKHEVGSVSNGGYTHDPLDPGGETKWGIAKRSHPNVDVKNLTLEEASKIYHDEYWIPMHLDKINNELLKLHLFDMGVNAGIKTAVRLLQIALSITSDGLIGPHTETKTNEFEGDIVTLYKQARIDYYNKIVKTTPTSIKFLHGWLNRIESTNFI